MEANLTAPTGVAAGQEEEAGQPAVKVAWSPVGLAMYYLVYRSEQADGDFKYAGVSDGRIFDNNGLCFYMDTDVELDRTYYYKIRAGSEQADMNNSGFSDVSKGVTVTSS
jgi:hypothetical protein